MPRPVARKPGGAATARAVLAVAAITGFGGAALALPAVQSKAAELSRTPYQATLSNTCNGKSCVLDSVLIQANRRLEIHHLSCAFLINNSNTYLLVRTGVAAANNTLKDNLGFHNVKTQPFTTGWTMFTVGEPVFMFVPGNRKLRISAVAGSGTLQSYGCFISGELVRLQPS
jgi:hypothetical protein